MDRKWSINKILLCKTSYRNTFLTLNKLITVCPITSIAGLPPALRLSEQLFSYKSIKHCICRWLCKKSHNKIDPKKLFCVTASVHQIWVFLPFCRSLTLVDCHTVSPKKKKTSCQCLLKMGHRSTSSVQSYCDLDNPLIYIEANPWWRWCIQFLENRVQGALLRHSRQTTQRGSPSRLWNRKVQEISDMTWNLTPKLDLGSKFLVL